MSSTFGCASKGAMLDTECMSRAFAKAVLAKLVDDAEVRGG